MPARLALVDLNARRRSPSDPVPRRVEKTSVAIDRSARREADHADYVGPSVTGRAAIHRELDG